MFNPKYQLRRKRRVYLLLVCLSSMLAWALLFLRLRKKLLRKKLLVIVCVSGLGNRIRALASASVLARHSNRELVVVWERDMHLDATFQELFLDTHMHVLPSDTTRSIYGLSRDNTLFLDLGAKSVTIPVKSKKHIHVTSGFRLFSTRGRPRDKDFRRELRQLQLALPLYTEYHNWLAQHPTLQTAVGVHIRNLHDLSIDVPGYKVAVGDSKQMKFQKVVSFERSKCDEIFFFAKMKEIVLREPNASFFLVSDTLSTVTKARALFGEHVMTFSDSTFEACQSDQRRKTKCIRHALMEMFMLGETRRILYSSWSSFSEVAALRGQFAGRHDDRITPCI